MRAVALAAVYGLLLFTLAGETLPRPWPRAINLEMRPYITPVQMDQEAALISAVLWGATNAGRFYQADLKNFKQQWQSLRPLIHQQDMPLAVAEDDDIFAPWKAALQKFIASWWPVKAVKTLDFCAALRQALAAYPDQWTQVRTLHPRNMCGTALRVYQGEAGPNLAQVIKRRWMIKKMMLGPRSFYVIAITDKIKGDAEFAAALANVDDHANIILDLRHLGPQFPFTEMQDFIPHNFQKKWYQSGLPLARVIGLWHQQIQTQLQQEMGKEVSLASQFTKEDISNKYLPLVQKKDFLGTGRLKGPLWVLVDKTCFRECEDFLSMLQQRPATALVGQTTPGEAHFDPPATSGLVLPYSHIFLQINLNYGELPGQDFIELQGRSPKIRVDRGGDAWQKLTQILKGDAQLTP